jgi:PPOX class probable F420-dependent enzyme
MPDWSPEAHAFLERHRVARLATAGADGAPHVIPVCFALDTDALYFVADEKPKRRPARELKRLANLRENPRAALVVDDYAEDWRRLAWLMVRGPARIVTDPSMHARALELLRLRYPQYLAMSLDDPARNPVVRLEPARVTMWQAES